MNNIVNIVWTKHLLIFVFLISLSMTSRLFAGDPSIAPLNAFPYCGSDYNASFNHYGGFYNQSGSVNRHALAALNSNGSIAAWGHPYRGGDGAPSGGDYVKVASIERAFAALKSDGSITAWSSVDSNSDPIVNNAPTDSGYIDISSNLYFFAALKADGSITVWGVGGEFHSSLTEAPTEKGHTYIASNYQGFAALKADGSISSWNNFWAPTDSGYVHIAATSQGFAAIKADGSIVSWGSEVNNNAPTDSGYVSISSTGSAFAALKPDGTISVWGRSESGGAADPDDNATDPPTDAGYISISANWYAFAALKADGSITAWGHNQYGGSNAPTDSGYTQIVSGGHAFAALKADGSISAWGNAPADANVPTGSGYISISANGSAFAALRDDGTIATWGSTHLGGSTTPPGNDFTGIFSNGERFAAVRADGRIFSWGYDDSSYYSSGSYIAGPTDSGYISVNGSSVGLPTDCSVSLSNASYWIGAQKAVENQLYKLQFVATDPDNDSITFSASGLPAWLNIDPVTGLLSGTPAIGDVGTTPSITVHASDGVSTASSSTFTIAVALAPPVPVISPNPEESGWESSQSVLPGDNYTFNVVATNPNNGTLVFSAQGLPAWLSVDTATGSLSGTPGVGDIGTTDPIIISVDDGTASASLTAFTIEVTSPLPAIGVIDAKAYCGLDDNARFNDYSSYYSAGSFQNDYAFTARKANGSINTWGVFYGDAPTDSGYVKIVRNSGAFAALKQDGSISTWGESDSGGDSAPADKGFINVYSTLNAFAALKADGSISVWGDASEGGSGAPTDSGYIQIYTNQKSFAAMKVDGTITVWGDSDSGGDNGPAGAGYIDVVSNQKAFAAIKEDGSVSIWGDGIGAGNSNIWHSSNSSFKGIVASQNQFTLVKDGGDIDTDNYFAIYGDEATTMPPSGGLQTSLVAAGLQSFAALKDDGSIVAWGRTGFGGSDAPTDNGYTRLFASAFAYAALKSDGSVAAWGHADYGGTGAPTDKGYVDIVSAGDAFAALKSDGSITSWGGFFSTQNPPADNGYISISSSATNGFAALKSDGSITAWGGNEDDAIAPPTDNGYISINGSNSISNKNCLFTLNDTAVRKNALTDWQNTQTAVEGSTYSLQVAATNPAEGTLAFSASGLPDWLTLDPVSGVLTGTPGESDAGVTGAIIISVSDGASTVALPAFTISVSAASENPDTDGDGLPDDWENTYGLSSLYGSDAVFDTDGDGLDNLAEYNVGTDPTKANTDDDAIDDKDEIDLGYDPVDPSDPAKRAVPIFWELLTEQ